MALTLIKFLRFIADTFFKKRYGHRAFVLETVTAVPGMVGDMLQNMKCLRRVADDNCWIKTLLYEAENERMHLMTFIAVAQPKGFERFLILMAQGIFFNSFFYHLPCSPRTEHRLVGYFEEGAVVSYTAYLAEIGAGCHKNIAAPPVAIENWGIPADARLRDVIIVIRADEARHRNVNHHFADELSASGKKHQLTV